jgi:hypothetical protein
MDGEAVKELATRFRGPAEVNGFIVRPTDWIADDPAALIKPGPLAKTLSVSTLGAVRDYLSANRDALETSRIVLHVAGAALVHVLGPLDTRARVRETFLEAKCTDLTEGFLGRYMSLEDFLVGLQYRFADVEDRKTVLRLLANVKHEQVKSAIDDGMTQVVQAKAGVALVTDVAVPNPITLVPFRTFRDIVQPSSPFVVRLKSGANGDLPQASLWEADGGLWKLTAAERIREWLAAALPMAAILA